VVTIGTVPDWRRNVRPCLENALRNYKAALVLHRRRLYPNAGADAQQAIEGVMEAALASLGIPVLPDRTPGERSRRGTHSERQVRFREYWLSTKSPFTREEQEVIAQVFNLIRTADRERLRYVDYVNAKAPKIKERESKRLIEAARRFYKIVRPHIGKIP
jgi:HEPN domain-containing protein